MNRQEGHAYLTFDYRVPYPVIPACIAGRFPDYGSKIDVKIVEERHSELGAWLL